MIVGELKTGDVVFFKWTNERHSKAVMLQKSFEVDENLVTDQGTFSRKDCYLTLGGLIDGLTQYTKSSDAQRVETRYLIQKAGSEEFLCYGGWVASVHKARAVDTLAGALKISAGCETPTVVRELHTTVTRTLGGYCTVVVSPNAP